MADTRGARGYTLFDTPIGGCGVVWGPAGVVGVHLPERDRPETRRGLLRRFPDAEERAPPADVPPFHRRVYEAAPLPLFGG